MPVWPQSLPQVLLLDGYQEEPPNLVMRTEMDAGPAKVRRRFTAGERPIIGALHLTKAQVQTLDDFYLITLQGGSVKFDWSHPRTGAAATFRLRKIFPYEPAAPNEWRARIELEQVPF